ncbi:MAG: hypothetical protein H6748_22500 [Spirochaetaceae bacterium]|nr:hypothetical protein [Myxococcales bacterium]MCB9726834.1 hypothetical protein [Spirochaetaceae bacterium]
MGDAQKRLKAAWDEMIVALGEARDAIDQPELMPAPPTDRNLAEGYRYLMGFVHSAVERAFHDDPDRPHFRNALSIITRSTIDNPDAVYFYAPIDGRKSYLLRGEMGDARHWKGEAPAPTGRKAPHYMIFEVSRGCLAGDSGDLSELRPGMKTQTGKIDSTTIEVDPDGAFEILFAPERPADWKGNFVPTMKVVERPHPTEPDLGPERYAEFVSGRQIFNDWDREDAVHFEMVQLGNEGTAGPVPSPEWAIEGLHRFGEIVRNQIHFWNAFWTIPMGTYGPRPGSIPGVAFPRNAFNKINAASAATGGGMASNLYAGGIAEIGPGEAMIVENRIKKQPNYVGFQLGNLWGESIEYANAVGSRNGHQTHVDDDGVIRLVIAHEDPGVHNWIDATGHPEVFMSPRWAYSQTPDPSEWPEITCKKVKLSELMQHLPASTKRTTPEERRREIAARQRHVRKRYRAF